MRLDETITPHSGVNQQMACVFPTPTLDKSEDELSSGIAFGKIGDRVGHRIYGATRDLCTTGIRILLTLRLRLLELNQQNNIFNNKP